MNKQPLIARGVRLHPVLWAQIQDEARQERRTASDYLRQRIELVFSFDPRVHEMHESGAE